MQETGNSGHAKQMQINNEGKEKEPQPLLSSPFKVYLKNAVEMPMQVLCWEQHLGRDLQGLLRDGQTFFNFWSAQML